MLPACFLLLCVTIVVNAVRSHFRKTRVRAIVRLDAAPGDDVIAAEPGPDHALEARRTAAWLDAQIARLPLEQREALLLCAIEGMEINDAADDKEPDDGDVEADQVVYICEGEQLCYGTKRAWDAAY